MKKIMEYVFISFLICFSFFYTDKVINFINKKDPLMVSIKEISDNYEILPVNGILDDDTMIPGINGKQVDVKESYDNMKSGGIFREDALIFKDIYPSNNLNSNYDKYIIGGNNKRKSVAIMVVFDNKDLDKLKKLEDITIFVNHKDLNIKNIDMLNDNEIYTYGNNGVYNDEVIMNDNTLINRMANNTSKFCLTKEKNDEVINVCSSYNMHTIIPGINGGYYEIKKNLSNGSIILLNNLENIEVILKYIRSKGYEIKYLSELLSE